MIEKIIAQPETNFSFLQKARNSLKNKVMTYAFGISLLAGAACAGSTGGNSYQSEADAGKPDVQTICIDNDEDGYGIGDITGCKYKEEDCNDNDETVFPGAAEYCDYQDNDCDGQTDEEVEGKFYEDNDGDSFGNPKMVKSCRRPRGDPKSDREYVANSGDCDDDNELINPNAPELCDDRDHDCDGNNYNGFENLGEACGNGELGECYREGEIVCSEDFLSTICNASDGVSTDELCDGLDNDCDNFIDNGLAPLSRECRRGTGECEQLGLEYQVCRGIEGWSTDYSDCDAVPGDSEPELCDDRDHDCDGNNYNGFENLGEACGNGELGECYREGEIVCSEDLLSEICNAPDGIPTAELCDGLDHDCDGENLNGFPIGEPCDNGLLGECFAEGEYICSVSVPAMACNAPLISPTEEECDGLDNDCDGETDLISRDCYGLHECSDHTETCIEGEWLDCPEELLCPGIAGECAGLTYLCGVDYDMDPCESEFVPGDEERCCEMIDDFERPDSEDIGGGWTETQGSSRIESGQAVAYQGDISQWAELAKVVGWRDTFHFLTQVRAEGNSLPTLGANAYPNEYGTTTGLMGGFMIRHSYDTISLLKDRAELGMAPFAIRPGINYFMKLSYNGSTLSAKIWEVADEEPATPIVSVSTANVPNDGNHGRLVIGGDYASDDGLYFEEVLDCDL